MSEQTYEPTEALRRLDRLTGTWRVTGGAEGTVTYEWMEGGFFLVQRVDLEQHGQPIRGIEMPPDHPRLVRRLAIGAPGRGPPLGSGRKLHQRLAIPSSNIWPPVRRGRGRPARTAPAS
jgi:hypothetical protein